MDKDTQIIELEERMARCCFCGFGFDRDDQLYKVKVGFIHCSCSWAYFRGLSSDHHRDIKEKQRLNTIKIDNVI